MAVQFPAPVNQLNLPAIDRAVQNNEWNALRMEGERQRQDVVGKQQGLLDEEMMLKHSLGLAKVASEGLASDPSWYAKNHQNVVQKITELGLDASSVPPATVTPEEAMKGFAEMGSQVQTRLESLMGEQSQSDAPAKIQQAEWWLKASPEQRAGYMSANYAGSVRDIGGVPHWVMPGGESVPLSNLDKESDAAAQIAMATGEGGRGRVEGPGGEFVNVPGTQADIDKQAADRKRGGGAFMKSIQAQTVVEDVFRLNKQLDAGSVPFGALAKAEAGLHPSLQSEGFRNANSLIESVKGNVGIDSLLRIKATGAGLGQVPQSQLDLLSRLLGELDLGQNEEQFRYTWNRMGKVYEVILAQAEDELIELGMVSPEVAEPASLGVDTPAPDALGGTKALLDNVMRYDAAGNLISD